MQFILLRICRFVNDVLHRRERRKGSFRRHPVERSHKEIIILSLPGSKPFGKVLKGIEFVAGVELPIVFPVTAFHLAVVSWREWLDLFVANNKPIQRLLKECQRLFLTVAHFICKLKPIICLDALNGIGELLYHMLDKLGGRVSALLPERLQIAEAAVFIDEGILIKLLSCCLSDQTRTWDIFHIDLDFLPRILHFLIRFLYILGIRELGGFAVDPLPELDPEHNQTSVGIPSAHIFDEGDLFFCMLIWVAMETA